MTDSVNKNGGNFLMIVGIVAIVVVSWMIFGSDGGDGKSGKDPCDDEIAAFVMSQQFVRDRLKSPSSAKFPFISNATVIKQPGCRFVVRSYVDSQNSFGAMLRTDYVAELELQVDRDNWRLHSLNFQ